MELNLMCFILSGKMFFLIYVIVVHFGQKHIVVLQLLNNICYLKNQCLATLKNENPLVLVKFYLENTLWALTDL